MKYLRRREWWQIQGRLWQLSWYVAGALVTFNWNRALQILESDYLADLHARRDALYLDE